MKLFPKLLLILLLSGCVSNKITPPGFDSVVVPSLLAIDFGAFDTLRFITVRSTRGDSLPWKINSSSNYVSVFPDSGVVGSELDTVKILIRRTTANKGSSKHYLYLTEPPEEDPTSILVSFENLPPTLILSSNEIDFGRNIDSLYIDIRNTGSISVNWEVTENYPWLEISPSNGTLFDSPVPVMLQLNRSILPPGNLHKNIFFKAGQIRVEANLGFTEGLLLREYSFENEDDITNHWDVWDQDTSLPFGIDTWGIGFNEERRKSVLWCNGSGDIYEGLEGHDGGMNANMALIPEMQIDISQYEIVTIKVEYFCQFLWQDDLFRIYLSGFDNGIIASFPSASDGWETFDYSFTNQTRFPQPLDIRFNYFAPVPSNDQIGVQIDDLQVWAK